MSYLIRNKKTGLEYWVEQETLDDITDKKMWALYERINPVNSKQENKPVTTPPEVIEFIKTKEPEMKPVIKPKYKPKKK